MRGKDFNTGLRGGLLDVRHYKRMGAALWLYGWLVLRQTSQSADVGLVLGGKPVSYREIEEETGFARKTLERWMHILRQKGYVETIAAPAGVVVKIMKAKKFKGAEGARFRKAIKPRMGTQETASASSQTAGRWLFNSERGGRTFEESRPRMWGANGGQVAGSTADAEVMNRGFDRESNTDGSGPKDQTFLLPVGNAPATTGERQYAGSRAPDESHSSAERINGEAADSPRQRDFGQTYRPSRWEWREMAVRQEARVGQGPPVLGRKQK